jgi:hypothetical protein
MTDADLDRIESALTLKLPAYYRRFVLDYPRDLAEKLEEWTGRVAQSHRRIELHLMIRVSQTSNQLGEESDGCTVVHQSRHDSRI